MINRIRIILTGESSVRRYLTATRFMPQITETHRSKRSDRCSCSTEIFLIGRKSFVNSLPTAA